MEMNLVEPTDWAAVKGRWSLGAEVVSYLGPLKETDPMPHGVALCDSRLRSGSIEVNIKFPEKLEKTTGGILFGYDVETRDYYYAGLGGYGDAYDLSEFRSSRGWRPLGTAGSIQNLELGRDYRVEARVHGQKAALIVDGIKVLSHNLPRPLPSDQIGLYGWGLGPVEFRSYAVDTKKPKVFVVMQFGEPYDSLYAEVVKPVSTEMGLDACRADDVYKPGIILQDIIRGIVESEVVIAEITSANPNVFYELGYAHATDKNTILLAERGTALPFDVQAYRCIFYDNTISGKSDVEEHLRRHLSNMLEEI